MTLSSGCGKTEPVGKGKRAMAGAPVDDTIYITSEEFSALISQSGRNNLLDAAFGGGKIWLRRDPAGRVVSQWALPHLAEMRGVDMTSIIGKALTDGTQ